MWTKEIMGMELLLLVEGFVLYSFLGWIVESVYCSICNGKWINRGFAFGPFCPIYGFGSIIGSFIMRPLSEHVIWLYITGALLATAFELVVGILMMHFLHEVWWDYNDKRYNYKGLICLERTLQWGIVAVVVVKILDVRVFDLLQKVPFRLGKYVCIGAILWYFADFVYHLIAAVGYDMEKFRKAEGFVKEKYINFKEKRNSGS